MINLEKIHRMNWWYRDLLCNVWPTPPRKDANEWAFIESGEAVNAHKNTEMQWARNHEKSEDTEEEEWADCLFMQLTALGPEKNSLICEHYKDDCSRADLAWYVTQAYKATMNEWMYWRSDTLYSIGSIICYLGGIETATRLVYERLEAIRMKRLPNSEPYPDYSPFEHVGVTPYPYEKEDE